MNVRFLMLPLFLTGVLLVGCDGGTKPKLPAANTDAKAADAKAAVDKAAADAKAAVAKDAADAEARAAKAAANAKAEADKTAVNARTEADKAAAKANDVKVAADVLRGQASALLADLQTAVAGQKWADAGVLVKQLDAVRDRLAADQKASFDRLKKQCDDNK